ncbi:MAG: hypothetical protein GX047_02820 [Firmicutes bacterium]|nr:hypothetical protein [Bacillota bacterium]
MDNNADIIITANSPGEVATWLTPAVKALAERMPAAEITVFTPPCTFSSGREAAVAAALPEVKRIFDARQTISFALFGRQLPDFKPKGRGVVLFLGGDLFYAVLLARRLGYPAYAYTDGRAQWIGSFSGFLLPDEQARQKALRAGAPPDKLFVVGDLMLDAVESHWEDEKFSQALGLDPDRTVIALFPGSRPHEFRHVLPMFLRSAEIISKDLQTVQFVLSISPFITEEVLRDVLSNPNPLLEGSGAEIIEQSSRLQDFESHGSELRDFDQKEPIAQAAGQGAHGFPESSTGHIWRLRTWGGLSLTAVQGWQHDLMRLAALAVTIPGSNTAEMAGVGLPMVVVTPLNKPELIPLEGIPGLIGGIPLVGGYLKRKAVLAAAKRIKFAALPNMKAQEEIVPELMGNLRPEDVAIAVGGLIRNPEKLRAISTRLKQLMGVRGAAGKIAETLAAALQV